MTLGYVTHVLAIREVCGWLVGAGSFVCWPALALALKLIWILDVILCPDGTGAARARAVVRGLLDQATDA